MDAGSDSKGRVDQSKKRSFQVVFAGMTPPRLDRLVLGVQHARARLVFTWGPWNYSSGTGCSGVWGRL